MATQSSKGANFQELDAKVWLQGLYEESSTQKHKIGTERRLSDGRVFVYGKAGGANLAVGVLVQSYVADVANQGNCAVANNANTGAKLANVTMGNLLGAANLFAEGFLHINTPAANGGGYAYKIKSHANFAANATVTYNLYDSLRANIHSAASKATLTRHPWAGVIIHDSPPTAHPLGVTVGAVTANYYAWFQKRGPAVVLANGTILIAQRVYPSTAVDGAVSPSSGNAVDMALQPEVGTVIANNANAHYAMIQLML